MATTFFLRLLNTPAQFTGFSLQEKDGAYLSPHGRMAARSQAATFNSVASATLCKDLWQPRLRQRWGATFEIDIEECNDQQPSLGGLETGAALLLARGRSQRFAANQSVPHEAIQAAVAELAELENVTL